MNSGSLIARMRDIHGIDPVSAWPPGWGWWLLALLALAALLALLLFVRDLIRYPRGSWQRDARHRLQRLRRQAPRLASHEIAGELSELLRRIAIARLGRKEAAGLSGEAWLAWLEENDPRGFPWRARGVCLLTLPYAPAGDDCAERGTLTELIGALQAWTRRGRGRRV
ncbi:MAG TPA: DUF4381 domain-containing protein [Thiotrichales bacterium]|nr:DUF4381 domain-containing protein [Thiotrichales bacterium]